MFGDSRGTYRGEFLKGKVHGMGSYQGREGLTFQGRFENGQQAEGELVWGPENKYSYKGSLVNNKFHGKGVLKKDDGVYRGPF